VHLERPLLVHDLRAKLEALTHDNGVADGGGLRRSAEVR
jgi:hypothetical protein